MKVVIKVPPDSARLQVNRLRGHGLWRVRKVKTEIYFQENTDVSSRFVSLNVSCLKERKSVLMVMGR